MRKLILILMVLAALAVMPGMAATREYFGSAGAHQIFNRPDSDYADNAALLADLHSEAEGTWGDLTTEQKTWEMVKFTRRHLNRGFSDKTKATSLITHAGLSEIFHESHHYTYGYMCEGFAHAFTNLCELEGIEAYTISAGDLAGTGWTHSVSLVRISVDGHYRMVLCDPYFGDMYYDTSGDPLSFFDMQDLITTEDYDQIYKKSIGYRFDVWTLTNATYGGDFYSKDYIIETLYTSGAGYRVWRTNNWFITPYCLETQTTWESIPYTNPYQAFNDVYAWYDDDYSATNEATVEARET